VAVLMGFSWAAHRRLTASGNRTVMTIRRSTVATEPGGGMDVVYVLCLMQVAFLVLGGLGEQLLMGGNPLYLVVPVAKIVLLLVFATKAVKGRLWALIGLIAVQGITLFGFQLQLIGGLLPMVDFTINLVGLLTNLALPAGVIWLCGKEIVGRLTVTESVPQDPYASAPTLEMIR
jgi:hypothetical protein